MDRQSGVRAVAFLPHVWLRSIYNKVGRELVDLLNDVEDFKTEVSLGIW